MERSGPQADDGHCLHGPGRSLRDRWERGRGRREGDTRTGCYDARAAQDKSLRASGSVVGDRNGCGAHAGGERRERDDYRAVRVDRDGGIARRTRGAVVVGVRPSKDHTRDVQRGGAGIHHRTIQRCAGSLRDGAEIEAARDECYRGSGGQAHAVQLCGFRGRRSVARDCHRRRTAARRRRGEGDKDGARVAGLQNGRRVAGVPGNDEVAGILASDSNGVQAQRLTAVAGDRQSLRAACLPDRQAPKRERCAAQQSNGANDGLRTGRLAEHCRFGDGTRRKDGAWNPGLRINLINLIGVEERRRRINDPRAWRGEARRQGGTGGF